jgi:Uma2 family endonuclease
MTAAAPAPRLTLAEFLAWEEAQEGKHEFVDGEVFAMAGGTKAHARIALNIVRALHGQLAARGCVPFHEGQLRAGGNIFYADVLVACGADALEGMQFERPVLIVEVLSSSTEQYDRGRKRKHYQEQLPSLQTYVLVAQDAILVEVLRRTKHGWTSDLYTRSDEVLELSDPPCRLTIAEIYEGLLDRIGDGR